MSGVGMPPYRRKGISNAVVIAVAMMVLLVGFLSYAYMGRIGAEYLGKALPEKLRQEGERGSELIRIYIWSRNHTLEGEPVITILNVWGKDSEIDVFMVANRTGHVVNVIALGPPMKVPASAAVELSPTALGLAYRTFGELIEYVGGVFAHTVLGNAFGSTWGAPREEYVFGTVATTVITNVTTTAWVIPSYSVQEWVTIPAYMTLSYPPEWNGNALIIAYDHLGDAGCGYKRPCSEPECVKASERYYCNYRYCKNVASTRGDEKPRVSGYFCDVCGPATDTAPRFSWYLAMNPLRIDRFYGRYYNDEGSSGCGSICSRCCWKPLWECSETWLLKNVTLSAVDPSAAGVYVATYRVTGTGQATAEWGWLGGKYTFTSFMTPVGYYTSTHGYVTITFLPPRWKTIGTTYSTTTSPTPGTTNVKAETTVTATTTYAGETTPQAIVETKTYTLTSWTLYTTTLTLGATTRMLPYTVTVWWWYPVQYTKTYTFSTYGTYVGTAVQTLTYTVTATKTVTYSRVQLESSNAWRTLTEPTMPPGYSPDYSQYEEGSKPGIYGAVPHLYFRVVYPIYIIHRFYEKAGCSCQTYNPPRESGKQPEYNGTQLTPPPQCDIVVKQEGTMTTVTTTQTLPDGSIKEILDVIKNVEKKIYVICRPKLPK
jgi:hypothetical protein